MNYISCIPLILILSSCQQPHICKECDEAKVILKNHAKDTLKPSPKIPKNDSVEVKMRIAKLISIDEIDSNIQVMLQYAKEDNFMHKNMYGSLTKAYMTLETAQKLHTAQNFLHQIDSSLCILVLDAARPKSVQKWMWDHVDLPRAERSKYLMNPEKISGHNYGVSVDVTLIDHKANKILDMGSDFDHFGELSEPRHEKRLLAEGKLTEEHIKNRQLLRQVMTSAGFTGIVSEWWHFNAMSRKRASEIYPIIP